jgi:hypothetical protein
VPARVADRPIATPAEDRLGLGPFVDGLARSLLSDDRRYARGVVLGLEGEWGSGKSSVLNLVHASLERQVLEQARGKLTVVRFDPWLISGRDDLVRAFARELLAETRPGPLDREQRRVLERIALFVERLAPATETLVPGAGKAVVGLVRAALGRPQPGLEELRRDVRAALSAIDWPIVVLIDELDRVEDAEVRTMAQLVRSVMDFPRISYLLAYDRSRVAEALGAGDRARGEAYLEKIVQLRSPVPAQRPRTLRAVLQSEFRASLEGKPPILRPPIWVKLSALGEAAIPQLIRTLRDIRRTLDIFVALEPILRHEIEPVDLLGWSMLLAKAPTIVETLRERIGDLEHADTSQFRQIIEDLPKGAHSDAVGVILLDVGAGVDWENRRSDLQALGDRLSNPERLLWTLTMGTHTPRVPIPCSKASLGEEFREACNRGLATTFLAQIPSVFRRARAPVPAELAEWLIGFAEEIGRRRDLSDQHQTISSLTSAFLRLRSDRQSELRTEAWNALIKCIRSGKLILGATIISKFKEEAAREKVNIESYVCAHEDGITNADYLQIIAGIRAWLEERVKEKVILRSLVSTSQIEALMSSGVFTDDIKDAAFGEAAQQASLDHLVQLYSPDEQATGFGSSFWQIWQGKEERVQCIRQMLDERLARG